jgi:hypothetical protein
MSTTPKTSDEAELPSLDLAALETVTGGAGADMSSMLPMMMMMKKRSAAAPAPAPAPAPVTPKILLNGVEQSPTTGANGTSFATEV